eukprot:SAG22_NODE_2431_length_2580_cov_1.862555_1_plen_58_part_00
MPAAWLLLGLCTINARFVSAQQKREYLFTGEDQTFIVRALLRSAPSLPARASSSLLA